MEINLELFNEVMKIISEAEHQEVFSFESVRVEGQEVYATLGGEEAYNNSVYYLMHSYKLWANTKSFNNNFVVDNQVKIYSCIDRFGGHAQLRMFPMDNQGKTFNENTEFEAVSKACEWIFKETK